MSKVELTYKSIYLVAVGESINGDHRVTARPAAGRPKTVRFLGRQVGANGEPMGTLVLNEELWQRWYENDELLAGFETAAKAARTLVARNAHILYGCPLCGFTCGTAKASKQHIEQHGQRVLDMFEVKIRRNKSGNKSTEE